MSGDGSVHSAAGRGEGTLAWQGFLPVAEGLRRLAGVVSLGLCQSTPGGCRGLVSVGLRCVPDGGQGLRAQNNTLGSCSGMIRSLLLQLHHFHACNFDVRSHPTEVAPCGGRPVSKKPGTHLRAGQTSTGGACIVCRLSNAPGIQ